MRKHFQIIFFFYLLAPAVFAGGDIDTNYVQKFKNIFSVKVFLVNNGYTYSLTPRNNPLFTEKQQKDAQVIFNPYIPPAIGIALNIEGVAAAYVFQLKNNFMDTLGRAKSAFKQFQLNIYKTKFGFEAYYQDYQRFYYHYKGDQVLLKNYNSDIRAYQFGVNAVFLFNGAKFSYNAAFNQSVLQKKSAGSWLLNVAAKFNELSNKGLIPDSVKAFYGMYTDLQRNRNYAFLLQTGYAFDLTKSNFYFAGALLGGLGIQSQTYQFPIGKFYKIAFPFVGRGKVSLGYNGKLFFTGVFANADVSQTSIKEIKTQQMVSSYGAYLGFRAIQFTKSKGQLKAEAKRKKQAEKDAIKKAKDDKRKAAQMKKKKK